MEDEAHLFSKICTSVDSWAVEYLLAHSASKLKHLTIQLCALDFLGDPFSKLFGCTHVVPILRRLSLGQFEQLLTQLPPLSSLVLVISLAREFGITKDYVKLAIICSATRILEHVNRDHLTDVRVEFKANPLAYLGTHISTAGTALEACKQLEIALLTFPKPAVLVHDAVHDRRAGRAKFWSPFIRRAFPGLDDRGLLTLKCTPCEWKIC